MTPTAITFMIIGLTIEFGGVILAISNQMKNDALAEKKQGK